LWFCVLGVGTSLTFRQRIACLDLDNRLMVLMQVSYDPVIYMCVLRLRDMYTLVQSLWVYKVMWTTFILLHYGSATLNSKRYVFFFFAISGVSTLRINRRSCITDLQSTSYFLLTFRQRIACLDLDDNYAGFVLPRHPHMHNKAT